jgi:hypothetical protein
MKRMLQLLTLKEKRLIQVLKYIVVLVIQKMEMVHIVNTQVEHGCLLIIRKKQKKLSPKIKNILNLK